MSNEKIHEQIAKLEAATGALGVKIAVNKNRIRALIGKAAGVKAGDVVALKGERFQVAEILSESLPKKGKPVLSGFKLAKNGNAAKRAVEIKGAWTPETAAAAAPAKRSRPPKATAPAKRGPGRPRKVALEGVDYMGTA